MDGFCAPDACKKRRPETRPRKIPFFVKFLPGDIIQVTAGVRKEAMISVFVDETMKNTFARQRLRLRFVLLMIVVPFTIIASHTVLAEDTQGFRDTGLVCAVDMGSNTFKFIVAKIENGQYIQYIDQRKTAGVGDDLKASEMKSGHKFISDDKIKEIQALIAEFQDECENRTHSRKIWGIATAAFREAENGRAISEQLSQQGLDMKILTGEEESAYAYEAATSGEPGFAVIDLGSRTTEFVTKSGASYQWVEIATGYKVAWDDLYDDAATFSDAAAAHLTKLKELISEKEQAILRNQRELVTIEVGETSSYILGLPQNEIEGKVISRTRVQNKLKELSAMNQESFADLKRNFKDAARVLPRLVVIDFILGVTGYDEFRATDHELNVAIVYRLSRSRID